jgi:hypothetical protein
MSRVLVAAALAAVLTLGACANAGAAALAATAAETQATTLAASGPSQTLTPEEDENLVWAAAVVRVDFVPNQTGLTAKLFGFAGGDPAMNGLYTYIAFLSDPHEAWRIFRLGDFLDYRILSASPGRVDVELLESTMSTATTEIGSRTRRVIVTWTPGADGAPPTEVAVAPAQ